MCYVGCGALFNMTLFNGKILASQYNKNEWIAENRVMAGEAGGIETVVKAINIHINNVDVCGYGCSALWNMTVDNGK